MYHALALRPDIRICVLDKSLPAYRAVRPEWVGPLSRGTLALDIDPAKALRRRKGWRTMFPSRFLFVQALERRRQASASAALCWVLDRLQRLLYWPRGLPSNLAGRDGTRHRSVAMALALAEPEPLGPTDTVLSVGSYGAGDFAIIAAMKRRHGFRYVGMCHDLIALRFPQYFTDGQGIPSAATGRGSCRWPSASW